MKKLLGEISHRFVATAIVAILAAAAAAVVQSPVGAESKRTMDVSFANITNAAIKVTAKDLNDGGKTIASDEPLKHNEQFTRKVVIDKDNNGHVSYSAYTTEGKRKCKSYEGKQLSNGFTFSITADKDC